MLNRTPMFWYRFGIAERTALTGRAMAGHDMTRLLAPAITDEKTALPLLIAYVPASIALDINTPAALVLFPDIAHVNPPMNTTHVPFGSETPF